MTFNRDSQQQQNSENASFLCKKCGYSHRRVKCPAFGKTCNKCGKLNHFAIDYQVKKNIRNVNELQCSEVDEFYVDAIQDQSRSECWMESLKIGEMEVKCKLDSEADCNVMPVKVFNELKMINKPKIMKAKITLKKQKGGLWLYCSQL